MVLLRALLRLTGFSRHSPAMQACAVQAHSHGCQPLADQSHMPRPRSAQQHQPCSPVPTAVSRQGLLSRVSTRAISGTSVDAAKDAPPRHLLHIKSNFCRMCGSKMELIKSPTEKEWRHTCVSPQCGYVDYHNPRMVVGCIVEHEGKILLAKRAIEPCKGLWTVPAGYMELAETTAQGAARETREEAGANVHILAPYCHWDIPVIGQTYILFRGQLAPPFHHSPGPESLETALFAPEDIPFNQIAFSSVALSLRFYLEDKKSGQWRIHHGVINKQPGSSPNDPATFGVAELLQLPVQAPS